MVDFMENPQQKWMTGGTLAPGRCGALLPGAAKRGVAALAVAIGGESCGGWGTVTPSPHKMYL